MNATNNTNGYLDINDLLENNAKTTVDNGVNMSTEKDDTLLEPNEVLDVNDAPKGKSKGLKYGVAASVGVGVAAAGAYAVEGADVKPEAEPAVVEAEETPAEVSAEGAATEEEIRNIILGGNEEDEDESLLSNNDSSTEEVAAEETAEVATEAVAAEETAEVATEEVAAEETAEVATEEVAAEETAEVATEEAVAEETAEVATEEVAAEEVLAVAEDAVVAEETAEVATEEVAAEETAEVTAEEAVVAEETAEVATEEAVVAEEVVTPAVDVPVEDVVEFNPESISLSHVVTDDMSFSEAFKAARADVGANGVFEWRGGVYGTYYETEWSEFSDEYKESFNNYNWRAEFAEERVVAEAEEFVLEGEESDLDLEGEESDLDAEAIANGDESGLEPIANGDAEGVENGVATDAIANGVAEDVVLDQPADDLIAEVADDEWIEQPEGNNAWDMVADDDLLAVDSWIEQPGSGDAADALVAEVADDEWIAQPGTEAYEAELVADSVEDLDSTYILADDDMIVNGATDDVIDALPIDIAENADLNIDVQVVNIAVEDSLPLDNMLDCDPDVIDNSVSDVFADDAIDDILV